MFKHFVIIGFLFFVAMLLFMYFWQRHLMYFPALGKPSQAEFDAMDMQDVTLNTRDGLHLLAWYKPALPNKPTILFIHGNAGHIGYRMPLARQFLNQGYGVLLLEYRGFGPNEGSHSEAGFYEDGLAAIDFLNKNGVSGQKLILYGESLGTGIATQLATQYPACALILQSPFTSFTALAKYHYPWVLIKPRDRYESIEKIGKVSAPVLVLHGKLDKIVPFSQGKSIFAAARSPKKMSVFDYAGHNNMWQMPTFVEEVTNFMTLHCTKEIDKKNTVKR